MRAANVAVIAGISALVVAGFVEHAQSVRADREARVDAEHRLAELQRELATLKAARCEPEPNSLELQDARAALSQEIELFRQAERLGIVSQVAKATVLTPRQQQRLAVAIVREARANRLDPRLVAAVIRVESAFDSFAVSPTGALGLMQLLPSTGRAVSQLREESMTNPRSLFDFERNVALGCTYLAGLVRQFGRLDHALLAYNIGPAAAQKLLLADEDAAQEALQGYARKVLDEFARISDGGPVRTASRAMPPTAQVPSATSRP